VLLHPSFVVAAAVHAAGSVHDQLTVGGAMMLRAICLRTSLLHKASCTLCATSEVVGLCALAFLCSPQFFPLETAGVWNYRPRDSSVYRLEELCGVLDSTKQSSKQDTQQCYTPHVFCALVDMKTHLQNPAASARQQLHEPSSVAVARPCTCSVVSSGCHI
jgi:hypothetical protein